MSDTFGRVLRRIGRTFESLRGPDAIESRRREDEAGKRLEAVTASLASLTGQVQRVLDRVERANHREAKRLRSAASLFDWSTGRQLTFARRVARASRHARQRALVRDAVMGRLERLGRGGGPILVGPWTGEVGFELLYWAPFVRWAVQEFGIDPGRVWLVARGGTASWYGIEGSAYLDALEVCAPEEFRQRTPKERKQRTVRPFDRELIRRTSRRITGGRPALLHPALMYALFQPFWQQQTSLRWVQQFSTFSPVRPPAIAGLDLPREYVAVRFYFSKCFPDTPGNQRVVSSLVRLLAGTMHVVVLGSGVRLDEHRDVTTGHSRHVHTVHHVTRAATNLALQTAVIGGAQAFIGTYGGFSYLAPLCGVRSIALYSRRNYYLHHLDFAQQLFAGMGGGSLDLVDVTKYSLARSMSS